MLSRLLHKPEEKPKTEEVGDTISSIFECPVCYERLKPPIAVCINGHGVCNSCLTKLLKCPTCKLSFSTNRNTLLDQIMEESTFQCKYQEKGCTIRLKLHELEHHEKNVCDYRTIKCELEIDGKKCEQQFELLKYYWHLLSLHKKDIVSEQFKKEYNYKINVESDKSVINIIQIDNYVLLEHIKLDKQKNIFYITFQYIGNVKKSDKFLYSLKIINGNRKFIFQNTCVPLLQDWNIEGNNRCLVLSLDVLSLFSVDGHVDYTYKIEKLGGNWLMRGVSSISRSIRGVFAR